MSRTPYMIRDRLEGIPKMLVELHPIPAHGSCHQTRVTVILQDKDQVGSTSSAPCMLTGLALQLVSSFKTPSGLIPRTIALFPAFFPRTPRGNRIPLECLCMGYFAQGSGLKMRCPSDDTRLQVAKVILSFFKGR